MSLQLDMLRRALKLRQCPNIAREMIKIDQPCLTLTNMLEARDDITRLHPAILVTMAGCFF
jgi:hypothetical protein